MGVPDLLANCAPTALSKNPPPEEAGLEVGLEEEGLEGGALVGVSDFFANWAPTALSKNPPPEEGGLDVPATQSGNIQRHSMHHIGKVSMYHLKLNWYRKVSVSSTETCKSQVSCCQINEWVRATKTTYLHLQDCTGATSHCRKTV